LVGWFAIACPSVSVTNHLKGAWSRSRDQLQNFTLHEISSERLKLQTSHYVHGLATRSTNFQMTNCPLSGRGQGHLTHSKVAHISKISLERLRQILCACRLYQVLVFGDRPSLKGAWPRSRDPFQNFTRP